MIQLPAVCGEWKMREDCWHFEVDHNKGGRMFFLHDGCTLKELLQMVKSDYDLDTMDLVGLTYSLPDTMLQQMPADTPPMHLTNERQLHSLVEISKSYVVRLCVTCGSEDQVEDNDLNVNDVDIDGGYDEYGVDDYVKEEISEHAHELEANDEPYIDGCDYSKYGKVEYEEEDDVSKGCSIGQGRGAENMYVSKSFASKNELISELRMISVVSRFSMKVHKSNKTLFVGKCSVNGCGWRIRASVKNEPNRFWVTKYVEFHTCSMIERLAHFRFSSPKYIAQLFLESFGTIDGITPKHIRESMRTMFGLKLDYTASYRTLVAAQELVRGSAEDGYEKLPSYLHRLEHANPGTITSLQVDECNRFKYLFIAFGASISGFQFLRRVIVVDGCHLSGKYGGVLLVACAQDGNFQIFPLAFGIVDIENDASWEWFFSKLSGCFSHQYPLAIVSDRHTSIKNACDKVLPWATRGICYYHLQTNIVSKFKGKHLLYLVKGAAYAYTLQDYTRNMDELRNINPALALYLEDADPTLWSRIHFQGNRYTLQTSNIAESLNSALKLARGFPITFLLEFIREKLGMWFCKRREHAMGLTTRFSRGVEYLLAVRGHYADKMVVERLDTSLFNVKGGPRACVVDFDQLICECGVWVVEQIPCSHVIAAAKEAKLDLSTLVSPYYAKDYLYSTYVQSILPISDYDQAPKQEGKCLPPLVKSLPGRKKKSRWQSWLEIARKKIHARKIPKQYTCSKCRLPGHTKANCVSS